MTSICCVIVAITVFGSSADSLFNRSTGWDGVNTRFYGVALSEDEDCFYGVGYCDVERNGSLSKDFLLVKFDSEGREIWRKS